MSGLPASPDGNQDQRIQAARDWLNRAEEQFADGQEVLAAATLMLAQAELKLKVEGISGTATVEPPYPGPRRFRMPFIGRSILGAAALAACFLVGMVIGQYGNFSVRDIGQPDEPATVIQIAAGEPTPVTIDPAIESFTEEPEFAAMEPETPVEAVEEVHLAEAPPVPRPVYRPRPVVTSEPEPSETTSPVRQTRNPLPTDTEPDLIPDEPVVVADVDAASSEGEISTAEVALATVRFLSERFLERGTE